jgi:hypothetical protein
MFGASRWLGMRAKAANIKERVQVTKDEFIDLLVKNGTDRAKAEFDADICMKMGSEMLIGDRFVGIKTDD